MAYTANTPGATDIISQTQPLILANFQLLEPWGNGYGAFSLQSGAPSFSANTDYIYMLAYATTSTNELWIHKQTTSGLSEIPFTASKMSNNNAVSSEDGWSYLPSGLLIKWGIVPAAANPVAITPTITSGGPNFTHVFQVLLTAEDSSGSTNFTCGQKTVPDNTSGNFSAYCAHPSATTNIVYLVIGI
jgi:hypothetical protein